MRFPSETSFRIVQHWLFYGTYSIAKMHESLCVQALNQFPEHVIDELDSEYDFPRFCLRGPGGDGFHHIAADDRRCGCGDYHD